MTNLDQYLIELERELNELKTDGLKSSSSLAVSEQTISVTQQLVGYDFNYHLDSVAGKAAAIIEIIPNDGKAMITSIALKTGAQYLINRYARITQRLMNDHIAYEFAFVSGSSADIAFVQNGGTFPQWTMEFVITATSEFTANLIYRQDH